PGRSVLQPPHQRSPAPPPSRAPGDSGLHPPRAWSWKRRSPAPPVRRACREVQPLPPNGDRSKRARAPPPRPAPAGRAVRAGGRNRLQVAGRAAPERRPRVRIDRAGVDSGSTRGPPAPLADLPAGHRSSRSMSSRQHPPTRSAQQPLCRERHSRQQKQWEIPFVVQLPAALVQWRADHLIDFRVDRPQPCTVGRTEVESTGRIGDVAQQRLIEPYLQLGVDDIIPPGYGYPAGSLRADTDGED